MKNRIFLPVVFGAALMILGCGEREPLALDAHRWGEFPRFPGPDRVVSTPIGPLCALPPQGLPADSPVRLPGQPRAPRQTPTVPGTAAC